MKGKIVASFGTFAVGVTEVSSEDIPHIISKGFSPEPRKDGFQLGRYNSIEVAENALAELGLKDWDLTTENLPRNVSATIKVILQDVPIFWSTDQIRFALAKIMPDSLLLVSIDIEEEE